MWGNAMSDGVVDPAVDPVQECANTALAGLLIYVCNRGGHGDFTATTRRDIVEWVLDTLERMAQQSRSTMRVVVDKLRDDYCRYLIESGIDPQSVEQERQWFSRVPCSKDEILQAFNAIWLVE
jgi:hypothetical protein